MPSHTFSPRGVILATSPFVSKPFFDRYLPKLEIRWQDGGCFAQTDSADAYEQLSDEERLETTPLLHEIYTIYSQEESGQAITRMLTSMGESLPEELKDASVQDLAMWTFLNHPQVWERLVLFTRVDTSASNLWHTYCVTNEGKPVPEDDVPDTETLSQSISQEISPKEGYARHVRTRYELSGQTEYYSVEMSGFPTKRTECLQGAFAVTTDNSIRELAYRYHRDTRRLDIKFKGDRRLRTRLCVIWADVIKGSEIEEDTMGKPVYSLEQLKDEDFRFERDAGGNVVSAHLISIGFTILGIPGRRISYDDSEGEVLSRLNDYLNRNNLPESVCKVRSVKIRVLLNDSFGRCKKQTLSIATNSCDVEEKNPKVRDVLKACLRQWGIVNA